MDRKKRFTFQRAVGGNNHHCCVPLCTAGGRFNKVLSFHSFPKEPTLRAQWLVKVRREGFTPTTSSRVCSRHFEQEDIVISSAGKRCLRPNIIPSLFGWNNYTKKPPRSLGSPASSTPGFGPRPRGWHHPRGWLHRGDGSGWKQCLWMYWVGFDTSDGRPRLHSQLFHRGRPWEIWEHVEADRGAHTADRNTAHGEIWIATVFYITKWHSLLYQVRNVEPELF